MPVYFENGYKKIRVGSFVDKPLKRFFSTINSQTVLQLFTHLVLRVIIRLVLQKIT